MAAHLFCDEPATHQQSRDPHVHANGQGTPTQATPDSYWVGGGVPQGESWGHAWGNQQEQANDTRGVHGEDSSRKSVGKDSYYSEAMTIPSLHCLEELLGMSRSVKRALSHVGMART